MKLVIFGLEESIEISDLGERTRMICKAFNHEDKIESIIAIHAPISILSRLIANNSYKNPLNKKYKTVYENIRTTIVQVTEKTYMMGLTSIIPETISFSNIDRKHLSKNINSLLNTLDFKDYILWISNPRIIDLAKYLNYRLLIFDAIDNQLKHPNMNKFYKKIKKAYKWIDKNADLICYASENQVQMFKNNQKLLHLPNGIDEVFLSSSIFKVIPELEKISRPLIGYIGVLQERFDVDLMLNIAVSLPDYNFILIGPVINEKYFTILYKQKNIYFIGSKKFNEIPAYISKFDIAIIPHKINSFTDSMDPLKIYEYLACGKPVVSTPIAGTKNFRNIIGIASTADEFVHEIKRYINIEQNEYATKVKTIAAEHTWQTRIKKILQTIENM